LAFGLKFNAKGIVDCYEKELESLPFGQKRDIEFKMIEGDFQLFEGKWSIEQVSFCWFSVTGCLLCKWCW
jgi:ribosome-associated toxin RatA of RatAB toxin-antitoxin module